MRKRTSPIAGALLSLGCLMAASCYDAPFDDAADGVFACSVDDDCAEGFRCVNLVCLNDDGPSIRIAGPEEDSLFSADQAVALPLTLEATELELDEPGGDHVPGEGYLTIELDGESVDAPIVAGNIAAGLTQSLDLGLLPAGLHIIRVRSFKLDGEPYGNLSSATDVGIWVDDGSAAVGVRRPLAGSEHPAGMPLEVEVRCLRCAFIDPDLASGLLVEDPVPEGHSHVYFDRQDDTDEVLDYPSCLPDCNFSYASGGSLKPTGERAASSVAGEVSGLPTDAGPLEITASLNYTGHSPVPAPDVTPQTWQDAPELYDQLVNDSITIMLVD